MLSRPVGGSQTRVLNQSRSASDEAHDDRDRCRQHEQQDQYRPAPERSTTTRGPNLVRTTRVAVERLSPTRHTKLRRPAASSGASGLRGAKTHPATCRLMGWG